MLLDLHAGVDDRSWGGTLTASCEHARRLSPHFVPRVLGNMAAGHVSMHHALQGPNLAPACAGAAGAQAMCDAFRLVQDGTADIMVAGEWPSSACMALGHHQRSGLCR